MPSQKPLVLKTKLAGGENSVIPKGVTEELLVEVIDGAAVYRFRDCKTTKAFAKHGDNSKNCKYIERLQKTICQYPGEKQQDIMNNIVNNMNELKKK